MRRASAGLAPPVDTVIASDPTSTTAGLMNVESSGRSTVQSSCPVASARACSGGACASSDVATYTTAAPSMSSGRASLASMCTLPSPTSVHNASGASPRTSTRTRAPARTSLRTRPIASASEPTTSESRPRRSSATGNG